VLEFIFRFLLEVVVSGVLGLMGRIGYWITCAIVPLLWGSRIFVAPPPNNFIVVRRWHGVHRLTDGTPVIGQRLASGLGLTLLAVVILTSIVAVKVLPS
jgi:hypothetical protein